MNQTERPQHLPGCNGTEEYGPCAACQWARETLLMIDAWNRWRALFKRVPRDSSRPQGMGQG